MTENKSEPANKLRSRSKKSIYTIVIGIVLVVLIFKLYLDYRDEQSNREFYQSELVAAQKKLDEINLELKQKIHQIDSLGGDINELVSAQEKLTVERDQLSRTHRANRELISRLRNKTEGYEELLKQKDKEIEHLSKMNEALLSENTDLKTQKNELNRSITSLKQDKEHLASKVKLAARLNVENLAILSVSKSGKERTGVLKRRQLSKLKVTFNIAENDVAPLETKTIVMRIKDENDQVLFDVARGSGSFILDGKETFYTETQDILFDNTGQKMTFLYDKGSHYDPGTYTLEIFTDGYRMGAATFTVK